jgi:hypothetical protein
MQNDIAAFRKTSVTLAWIAVKNESLDTEVKFDKQMHGKLSQILRINFL